MIPPDNSMYWNGEMYSVSYSPINFSIRGPLIKSCLPTQTEKTQDDLGAPNTEDSDTE